MELQADLVVAKAQQAAADAAQRSDEEAARLRRDSEAWRKEKRGLVQRCTSAERDLAAAVVCILLMHVYIWCMLGPAGHFMW